MKRVLMLCGVLAPVVYLVTVLLGGLLRPEYSHVSQPVSDLIASGAPNKLLLDTLFGIYNLLTAAIGFALLQSVRTTAIVHGRTAGIVGALFLIAEGIFGVATLFFPEDAGGMGAAISGTGMMHVAFAGLSSLTSMLTILVMGLYFRNTPRLRGLGAYSFVSVAAVFLSGGLAAASVANHSPWGGLIERITIGGFLQWLCVIAWRMSSTDANDL